MSLIVVKKFGWNRGWNPLAAGQEKYAYWGSSKHPLISCRNLSLCLVLAIGFVLYTKLLLEDVSHSLADFPGPYVFLKFPTANNDSAHNSLDGRIRASPAAPATPLPPARNSKDRPKKHPKSKNEHVQDGGLKNPTSTTPEAPATTIAAGKNSTSTITTQPAGVQDGSLANSTTNSSGKFSVLVGVFMMAYEMERRSTIRLAYSLQSSEDADFTVRFILGGYQLETWLEGENATHGDIIVLQCEENLNEGKTFTFFSSLSDMGFTYDYVMKADDDSYVRFDNLGKHLKAFPRTDLYYGYSLPCDVNGHPAAFRVGAGYVISWDLVVWITDSPIPRNKTTGVEDQLVGDWFRQGDIAKNRPSSMFLFHDFSAEGGSCSKDLSVDSILIHKLKTEERWYKVIEFYSTFNSLHN